MDVERLFVVPAVRRILAGNLNSARIASSKEQLAALRNGLFVVAKIAPNIEFQAL